VAVLGIENIIVCGHSQCGAMGAILQPEQLNDLPAAKAWFNHCEATRRIVQRKYQTVSQPELVRCAAEENVLVQMNNLSTHPVVAARLATDELRVYGWYYDIGSGSVSQFDQRQGEFLELGASAHATSPMPVSSAGRTVNSLHLHHDVASRVG
ncbi:MAG TPA: carbonic anhydrase, partial [Pirellulales bacterium]